MHGKLHIANRYMRVWVCCRRNTNGELCSYTKGRASGGEVRLYCKVTKFDSCPPFRL